MLQEHLDVLIGDNTLMKKQTTVFERENQRLQKENRKKESSMNSLR